MITKALAVGHRNKVVCQPACCGLPLVADARNMIDDCRETHDTPKVAATRLGEAASEGFARVTGTPLRAVLGSSSFHLLLNDAGVPCCRPTSPVTLCLGAHRLETASRPPPRNSIDDEP